MSAERSAPQALGFIGLGVMGSRMCANLIQKSGARVHVYDPLPEASACAAAAGGEQCASVADVGDAADIVFLSLPGIAQVEAVCEELLAAPHPPRTVVDMSTSDVTRTRDLASRLDSAGLAFADAPVARTRQAAADGTLLITIGAREALFAELPAMSATARS
jgi:3-hydroxyisobutyrate dehydrogenase-like beta-hydroxyacid dehydrogenase